MIGGGLAGLTVAREIARSGWSVVLLEAGRLAGGASGRSTGFVLPGFAAAPDTVIARVGFERAKDLWALSQAGLDYVRSTIREASPASMRRTAGFMSPRSTTATSCCATPSCSENLGCEVESWPTERVRAVPAQRALLSRHPLPAAPSPSIRSTTRWRWLTRPSATARAFSRIRPRSRSIRRACASASSRRRAVARRPSRAGRQRAAQGTDAARRGDAHSDHHLRDHHRAAWRAASLTRSGYRGAVSDTDLADNHYRIVGGDRLMWSGRATVWPRDPRNYVGALTADIEKTYPQLGEVAVDYAWAGTLGQHGASHAADRRTRSRRVARERLWRPRPEHHRDGRQPDRPRRRRGRSHLAAIYAV